MYVAGLFAWVGWTLFYGNAATGVGLALTEVVPRTNRRAYTLLGEHEARQGWRNRFVPPAST